MAGPLTEGVRLEPGTEPFGSNVGAAELHATLLRLPESEQGRAVISAWNAAVESTGPAA